ncbi:hypothetical protein ES705_24895 [subsurface metagenome]
MTGKIIYWNEKQKWGYIKNFFGKFYFFHFNDVQNSEYIQHGRRVRFKVKQSPHGSKVSETITQCHAVKVINKKTWIDLSIMDPLDNQWTR